MLFFTSGAAAFFLFYLYDFNTVFFKTKIGKKCFLFGALLLLFSTVGLICPAVKTMHIHVISIIEMVLAIIFLFLEIYTLFGALPVEEAYSGELSKENKVYNKGMYALCRHPGVLWFAGFYLFLALALDSVQLLTGAVLFTALDFIYIVLQDMIIFPKQFSDYETYKKATPFLIPNLKSIRDALKH